MVPPMVDPIRSLAVFFWLSAPLKLLRRFPSMRGVFADWHGVALVPPVAVVSPVVVGVGFLAVGMFGFGYEDVYSESLLLMAAIIGLGAFSGQLGALGLLSFAVGDFFVRSSRWRVFIADDDEFILTRIGRWWLPLIITYLLLAVAVLVIPRLGRSLAFGVGRWRRIPTSMAWLVSSLVVVVASWVALRTWVAAAPTLIRPRFTWFDTAPTVDAIMVFQQQGQTLVAAGVAATVVRQLSIGVTIYVPAVADRMRSLEARGYLTAGELEPTALPGAGSGRRQLIAALVSTSLATLTLAGVMEHTWLWFLTAGVFFVVRALRSGLVVVPPVEWWKPWAARIPVVVRLGLVWLGASVFRSVVTDNVVSSYASMAVVVVIGVVLAFVLFPGDPQQRPTEGAAA